MKTQAMTSIPATSLPASEKKRPLAHRLRGFMEVVTAFLIHLQRVEELDIAEKYSGWSWGDSKERSLDAAIADAKWGTAACNQLRNSARE